MQKQEKNHLSKVDSFPGNSRNSKNLGIPRSPGSRIQKPKFESQCIIHVNALTSNLKIVCTTLENKVIAWSSNGCMMSVAKAQSGVKLKKSSPTLAYMAGESLAKKIRKQFKYCTIHMKGVMYTRDSLLRGLKHGGIRFCKIKENTSFPHNGCRPRKSKRIRRKF